MSDDVAIKVEHVSKTFRLPHEKHSSLKGALISKLRGNRRSYERQEVLKDISFDIKKGEFFGIVGRNGSGKSTLLKMLAGIYSPTEGDIQINGKLTPFIELGVGFNPELTGRENVFLNGALLGFNRAEMNALYDDIVTFAELEKFMDQKLKNYSSGMQVRLAFSIAIRAESDILLLDEVLAVGDAVFQKKCYDYFKQLKKDRRTVVFVSHDTNALLEYCDKGILIEKGEIVESGKIENVVNEYIDVLNSKEGEERERATGEKKVWGVGGVEIIETTVMAEGSTKPAKIFDDTAKRLTVRMRVKSDMLIPKPVFGIVVLDSGGQRVFSSNTLWSRVATKDLVAGTEQEIVWHLPNAFNSGTFSLSPAVADSTGGTTYIWQDEAVRFKIRKRLHSISYINIDHEIEIR